MGFLLLWVESLAVSLLSLAWVTACVGRWRRRWLRTVVWMLVSVAVLLIYAYGATYAEILQFVHTPGLRWFYYALALAVAVLIGAVSLLVLGLRPTADPASPTAAARWPRGKLFAAWGVVLVLHVFTIQNLDQGARRQLDAIRSEAIAQIRAAARPPARDSDNAAILYSVAADALCNFDPSSPEEQEQSKWLAGLTKAFDAEDPALNRFMQEKEPVVRILHEAARRPTCVVAGGNRMPFSQGILPVTHWNRVGDLERLLAIHSRWRLAQGDRRAAFEDVDALFRFAGHMSNAGLLPWAYGANRQALIALQYLLSAGPPTAEELQIIHIDEFWSSRRAELRNWPVTDAQLRWCLHDWGSGNLAKQFAICQYHSPWLGAISNSSWYRIFLLQNDLALLDRISSEWERQLSVPYWVAAKRAAEKPTWREKVLSRSGQGVAAVSLFAVQILGHTPEVCAKADAWHATAVVALALARYQVKHGQLPENLDALVPEFLTVVPLDPFDGKPIKYETTDSGVVIYSVGRHDRDIYWGPKRFELPRWH